MLRKQECENKNQIELTKNHTLLSAVLDVGVFCHSFEAPNEQLLSSYTGT
jgi:hypothetical protein